MPGAKPGAVAGSAGRPGAEVGAGPVGVVRDFVAWLAGVDGKECEGVASSDAARLDLIGALEAVKAAAAAAQARVTTAFAASQREVHLARGGKPQQAARSIGSQVALARRDSPSRGDQHVGFAHDQGGPVFTDHPTGEGGHGVGHLHMQSVREPDMLITPGR